MRWLSGHLLDRRQATLSGLAVVAAALQVAAGAGMAYVAGFGAVRAALAQFHWPWVPAMLGALAVSFVGYYYAYRAIFWVKHRPSLTDRQMRAVATAGFSGFLGYGGDAVDDYAMRSSGVDERAATVRVSALAGLEYGVLALGTCAAAIAVLTTGLALPPRDFTLPWAIIPVPGFLVAFWAAKRFSDRLAQRGGWRGKVATFLQTIDFTQALFAHPFRPSPAALGMGLFWAGDTFAAWAGLAAFGFRMNVAQLIVGYATGMVFTRRTGPLGGAGVLTLVLPATLWYSGAPLAVAVVGTFVYRVVTLWVPMPFSLASLPTLRAMGEPENADQCV